MQPFLPEHVPEPALGQAQPVKRSTTKALFLWVALIVMFLTIWQFLTPSDNHHAPKPECIAPCQLPPEPSFWSSTVVTLVPVLVLIFFFFLFVRRFRVNNGFNIEQEPGLTAIADRRFAEGAAMLRQVAMKQKQPTYGAVALINVGDAELWGGNIDAAIAALADASKRSGAVFGSGIRLMASTRLAVVYALAGDVDAALRWCDASRTALEKNTDDRLHYAAKIAIAEAILACRRGQPREARAPHRDWLRMRHALTANWMRVAEVIRAFAEAQGDLREQNVVAGRVLRVEPVVGTELAFLGKKWPEMETFLITNGLAPSIA